MNEAKNTKETKNKNELENLISFDGFQLIFRLGMFLLSEENKMNSVKEENKKMLETKINDLLESKKIFNPTRIKQDPLLMGKNLFQEVLKRI